ncbi:MAG: hypothetical protein EOM20_18515, partial [Spartobacteria bacterium]|nr:hypothetical protein [Spartobacteria bacterium]
MDWFFANGVYMQYGLRSVLWTVTTWMLASVGSVLAFSVGIGLVTSQEVRVAVQSDTNAYYIMFGADSVTQSMPALGMALGAENELVFTDTRHATNHIFFYKAGKIDRQHPADMDEDGMDDVFELERPFLDALGAADAIQDEDRDGYSNLREYLEGSCLTNRYHAPNPPWVHAEGKYLLNAWGERVLLQGVNIGGYLVHEDWMTMIDEESAEAVWAKLTTRFGGAAATNLMHLLWDHYFQSVDLDMIKEQGYNHVRVPFLASLLADEGAPYSYKTSGWARLDWIVGECARRGLYCILDMHGTPGGNNPFPHSGFSNGRNELWTNTVYQQQFVEMWVALARHFETNSAVLAYELCNEPDPPGPSKIWSFHNLMLPLYRRAYSAIRSNDTQHLIVMMDNFCGLDQFPLPADEGWTNVIYAAHHYENVVLDQDLSFAVQQENGQALFRRYSAWMEARDVPMYIGEFMSGTEQNMDYFMRHFRAHGIHMAHWNFKIWDRGQKAWGLLYRTQWWNNALKPNLDTDSYATLSNKFVAYASAGNYTPNLCLQQVVRNNTYCDAVPSGER